MKKILFALLFAVTIVVSFAQTETMGQNLPQTVVYYFHGQFRCYSCTRIEELTRMSLQKGFARELASGAILFRPVNVDLPQNEHYISDYRLRTRSVVLSRVNGGKEINWKNLERVWDYFSDEKAFLGYIISEIKSFRR
ncbi:MAG TPA: nitrophenyl compound nitroreductase subunit ArsF family protein [Spirochaetota bacterium]|nr:nitrophenyl compound nitroreductase subunit ArsF family protein [Spirochaetota bacterium]HPC42344.1 nitrophenyl compound nitroreductase subunit ArsF family protein [Spirochaetota bacterium]HPL17842.1 nitrophenyl compound nitroreductase subunit ArsF family protein [Spirochaetota bacterium]HQF10207.1 nitrophenyl compound nitroreductase subunit ArsF family protein [Spirochaetota bacterium]HQH99353.1 nitrophenyl compound nitroreductase subunit ArsF family protein [Spirochaetota bacterium]